MNLTIEMHNPQKQILEELADRQCSQESVAITYAFLFAQEGATADWARVNQAIRARWQGKSALTRIKELAWKRMAQWEKRGQVV